MKKILIWLLLFWTSIYNVYAETIDISNTTSDSISHNYWQSQTWNTYMKEDWTKIYKRMNTSDVLYEFTLSIPYDITSETQTDSYNLSDSWYWIHFCDDWTCFFYDEEISDDIKRVNLSSAWDLTTAWGVAQTYAPSYSSWIRWLVFNSTGTSFYIYWQTDWSIRQYNMSTPWQISSWVTYYWKSSDTSHTYWSNLLLLYDKYFFLHDNNTYWQYSTSDISDITLLSDDSLSYSISATWGWFWNNWTKLIRYSWWIVYQYSTDWVWPSFWLEVTSSWSLDLSLNNTSWDEFEATEDWFLKFYINSDVQTNQVFSWATETDFDLDYDDFNFTWTNSVYADVYETWWTGSLFTLPTYTWSLISWSLNSQNYYNRVAFSWTTVLIDYDLTYYLYSIDQYNDLTLEKSNTFLDYSWWLVNIDITNNSNFSFTQNTDYALVLVLADTNDPTDFYTEQINFTYTYYWEVPVQDPNAWEFFTSWFSFQPSWFTLHNFIPEPYGGALWFEILQPDLTWSWTTQVFTEKFYPYTETWNWYWFDSDVSITMPYHQVAWNYQMRALYEFEQDEVHPFWTWFIVYPITLPQIPPELYEPVDWMCWLEVDEDALFPWISNFFACTTEKLWEFFVSVWKVFTSIKSFFDVISSIWDVEPDVFWQPEAFFEFLLPTVHAATGETYVYTGAYDPLVTISQWSFEDIPLLDDSYNFLKYLLLFAVFAMWMFYIFNFNT